MILKKEISSQFVMLNLAQTLFWITNHIAQVVDTKIAMDKIGAMKSERDDSEPPIFRALRELQNLKGDEGSTIIHRPLGGGAPIEISNHGGSISADFSAAEQELLRHVGLGQVDMYGRPGKTGSAIELIDRLNCRQIVFKDPDGKGNRYPRAVYRDHHETYWDLIGFNGDQIFEMWPPNELPAEGGVDLRRKLNEAIAEKKKSGERLTQRGALEINNTTGAKLPRHKVREMLSSLESYQFPDSGKRGRPRKA